MGHHVLAGNPPVEITLRASSRARRISLRISGLDGRVTLTYPHHVAPAEALEFAHSKADWLRARLDATPQLVDVVTGVKIPVEDRLLRISIGSGRRVAVDDEALYLPKGAMAPGALTEAWLKTLARDRLAEASDRYASRLGRSYTRLTLRDTRSRWGSCSSSGGLMYSWRLIMAPPDVLDYVAAHEVAHLQEMHHGPEFWELVEELCPAYHAPRRWLRENGSGLHRYRFRD